MTNNSTSLISLIHQSARSYFALAAVLLVGMTFANLTIDSVSAQEQLDREDLYSSLAKEADIIDRHYGLLKKVVKVVQPSVVHIQANKTSRGSNNSLTQVEEAGAGVIIRYEDRYYVITNRHVILDAENRNIQVQLENGRFFNPIEVRTDPDSDIAVLFLAETDLEAARFADSDKVSIGDFVVAVGSPFGLSHSVSYGIISARGRRDLELGNEGVKIQDFLQTDAAINPGNSGGPLLNLRGEVIGINTAIASNSGGNDGIGFSIPANMVAKVVKDLLRYNRVRRGFVGVTLDRNYSAAKAKTIGLNTAYGARVTKITAKSPASETTLRRGDVILKFNNEVIKNDSHLVSEVSQTAIGSQVPMLIYRNGQQRTIEITVREKASQLTSTKVRKRNN